MFSKAKFAAVLVAASAVAGFGTPALAQEGTQDDFMILFKMSSTDKNKDGMISKAEMMKMMEQMFDKHDAKKTGKLDKKQVDAFLAELIKSGN